MVQGTGSVGPLLVQTELPLVRSAPTWANLCDCIEHAGGEVAAALSVLPTIAKMTITIADIPDQLLVMMSDTRSPEANFRVLDLHPAAQSVLAPSIPSTHTREILEHYHQPPDTPVFVMYVYT